MLVLVFVPYMCVCQLLCFLFTCSCGLWFGLYSCACAGTYNNQYVVLDMKLFSTGAELQAGALTVAEQIPGLVLYDDVTQQLERGYWPSYNVPYFPEIYEKSTWAWALRAPSL